ncbi:MAG: hypothetical protein U1F68_00120 [Gammaproteobacteria bacterium]
MAIADTRILVFDIGIERIIQGDATVDHKLPERNALPPTGEQVRVRLDEVLNAPALDDMLRAFLKPPVVDKTILAPGRYQSVLDAAQRELQTRSAGGHEALAKAAALLGEEQQLRTLLNTLRNILVQA